MMSENSDLPGTCSPEGKEPGRFTTAHGTRLATECDQLIGPQHSEHLAMNFKTYIAARMAPDKMTAGEFDP